MKSMVISFSFYWWLAVSSLSLTSGVTAFGIRPFSRNNDLNSVDDQGDLASLLHFQPTHQEDVFSQALQLLDSLNSSPSCNRIAASRLLTSCQSVKGGSEENGKVAAETLDFVKSLYATRLAICELTGAGAALPTDCSPVTASPEDQKHVLDSHQNILSLEEDRLPSGELERCLKSLESRPQWWTSYSNSRQNAVVMCQAARIEIDKEELLSLHKTLTETTSGLARELKGTLRNAMTESSRNKEFMEAVEAMRVKLSHDLNESSSFQLGLFSTLLQSAENFLRDTVNNVVSTVKGAEFHAEALHQNLEQTNNGVNDLRENIRSVYEEAVERSTEFSSAHKKDLEANHDLAVAVQHSLDSIKRQNLNEMTKEFGEIQFALEAINQLVTSMHYKQSSLDERLQTFDQSFQSFEQQAENLHTAHAQQADEQLRLQESMRREIQIARALLDEVTATAANLQTSVEETSMSFGKILGSGVLRPFSYLAWIYFSFIIFSLMNPKVAVALILISIPALLWLVKGIPEWVLSIPTLSFENLELSSYMPFPLPWLGLVTLAIYIIDLLRRIVRSKLAYARRLFPLTIEKHATICQSCLP